MRLASRGLRDLGGGEAPHPDDAAVALLRRRARWITAFSVGAGILAVVAAIAA